VTESIFPSDESASALMQVGRPRKITHVKMCLVMSDLLKCESDGVALKIQQKNPKPIKEAWQRILLQRTTGGTDEGN
jgi:hypothetical protein